MPERSVILVLPTQEALHDSAMMRLSGGSGIGRRLTGLPARAEIDTGFSAVPLGNSQSGSPFSVSSPDGASHYAVRATIDAEAELAALTTEGAAIFSDPPIAHFAAPAGAPGGTRAEVEQRLGVSGLAARRLDGAGVAIAVVDTGINLAHLAARDVAASLDAAVSWPPRPVEPGHHPVGPGTMCAYGALIAAPQATLIDLPVLPAAGSGSLSDALQAYAHLLTAVRTDKPRFKALVVTNSWGLGHESWDFPPGHPGRYVDNPGHPFNRIVGALSRYGVDILFAAGNDGPEPQTPPGGRAGPRGRATIMGANAHPDVITVTGATLRGRLSGDALQGPGIPGMVYAKPDLASYTDFLGSEAGGPGKADVGTSAACPVAAGCVAALRTRLPHAALNPRDLTVALQADASRRGPSSWHHSLGYGVMAPLRTAMRLGL
ncbi:S8 family serine peptidase [Methylobacterium sp. EM32]|uniref:S8 family serine peptidase n=1 Tax=Methylobacterium sp. EM32 TaxID=3163481 RepID=UPI0033B998C3